MEEEIVPVAKYTKSKRGGEQEIMYNFWKA